MNELTKSEGQKIRAAIERLKELDSKATPGRWIANDGAWNGSSISSADRETYISFTVEKYIDAECASELRNAIPKLIEILEAALDCVERDTFPFNTDLPQALVTFGGDA